MTIDATPPNKHTHTKTHTTHHESRAHDKHNTTQIKGLPTLRQNTSSKPKHRTHTTTARHSNPTHCTPLHRQNTQHSHFNIHHHIQKTKHTPNVYTSLLHTHHIHKPTPHHTKQNGTHTHTHQILTPHIKTTPQTKHRPQ